MIRLLFGDNDFEKRQALLHQVGEREVERHDGETLSREALSDLIGGQTLFGGERTIVIYGLSDNADIWPMLPELLRSADVELFLVEGKLDKRTKTYKWLQKEAKATEYVSLTDRQRPVMVDWVVKRAEHHGYNLERTLAMELVDRLGYDQLRIDGVLEQLSFVHQVSKPVIDAVVPLAKSESAFELFEAALRGDISEVQRIVSYLEQTSGTDGAYMTMGLLASQLINLNGLVLSDGDAARVAADLGAHPFVLKKLAPLARSVTKEQLAQMNVAFARADEQMKSTGANPWMLIEIALATTARLISVEK